MVLKPNGFPDPALIWSSTGVVGCDPEADPSPDEYRFTRMEEAEDALKSRTFMLTILDEMTQTSAARIPLGLKVRETNLFFFSDEDGCPRCQYGLGEPIFFSGSRVVDDSVWMFLVAADDGSLKVGDPLEDVRGEPLEIQSSSSYFTKPVPGVPTRGPVYLGAIEPGDDGSDPPAYLTPAGVMLDPAWNPCPERRFYLTGISPGGGDKPVCP